MSRADAVKLLTEYDALRNESQAIHEAARALNGIDNDLADDLMNRFAALAPKVAATRERILLSLCGSLT